MSILYCSTNDHVLNITEKPILASGSRNVDYMQVAIDDTWSSLENVTYHANFYMTSDEDFHSATLNQINGNIYKCVIPYESYADSGILFFGIFAKRQDGEIVKTSTIKKIRIKQGIMTEVEDPPDVFDVLFRFITMFNNTYNLGLAENASVDEVIRVGATVEDWNNTNEGHPKPLIIDALWEHFNIDEYIDKTYDLTTQDIIEVINDIEEPEAAKRAIKLHFVNLLNRQLDLELNENMPNFTISNIVVPAIQQLKEQAAGGNAQDYSDAVQALSDLSDDYITDPTQPDPNHEWVNYAMDIGDFMEITISALSTLYGGD